MTITLDTFKQIIERLKDSLLEKPKTKLFIEDIARAASIDVKTAESIHDLLSDLDAMLVDVEVDKEIRGKYIRYFPDDDEDDGEDEDGFEDEDAEDGET
jgi:hypothetical protein